MVRSKPLFLQLMILLSTHRVPDNTHPIRLLEYVLKTITTVQSRNSAKKAIKKGLILLDGKVVESARYVNPGQTIEHYNEIKETKPFEKQLEIVFEDDSLAIINKPAGISVSGNYFRTIQNALAYNLKSSNLFDRIAPVPVHRLDNQTTGLLLVAKTQNAVINLGKQFERKAIAKQYRAIVIGTPSPAKNVINSVIDNKESCSEYECISVVKSLKYSTISLVNLIPYTGRTHQLRIHMSELGNPIIGDKLYTEAELLFKGKGLFLQAYRIDFEHPLSKQKLHFELELPHKFASIMNREKIRWERAFNNT